MEPLSTRHSVCEKIREKEIIKTNKQQNTMTGIKCFIQNPDPLSNTVNTLLQGYIL